MDKLTGGMLETIDRIQSLLDVQSQVIFTWDIYGDAWVVNHISPLA
jgi:hypothetical protein